MEFADTPYFKAYMEYVLMESGKCLGGLRITRKDPDQDTFIKGKMSGMEQFFLDIISELVDAGHIEKANRLNIYYTEELLKRSMGK